MSDIKITHLAHDYSFDNGNMHAFKICFSTGQAGVVYAKSNPPPYGVGDSVEITIKGQTKTGDDKFGVRKIATEGSSNFKTVPNQRFDSNDATRQPQLSQHAHSAPNGARSGMIVNNAVSILVAQNAFSIEAGYKAVDLVTALTDYVETSHKKSEPVVIPVDDDVPYPDENDDDVPF